MKRVLIAMAIVALAVGAAGCGSKKKSSSSSTTTTTASSTSSSSSSSSSSGGSSTSFASVKNCKDLQGLTTTFSQSLASGNYDKIAKTYRQLAAAAPSEIRGDLNTLSGALQTYLGALKTAGYKAGTTATPAQMAAALQSAGASFTQPKFKNAVAHLEAWGTSHCGAK